MSTPIKAPPTMLTQDGIAAVIAAQQVSVDNLSEEVRALRKDVKDILQTVNQAKGGMAVAGWLAGAIGLASGGLSGMIVTALKNHA